MNTGDALYAAFQSIGMAGKAKPRCCSVVDKEVREKWLTVRFKISRLKSGSRGEVKSF